MMANNDERIEAIRKKAEGMGLIVVQQSGSEIHFDGIKDDFELSVVTSPEGLSTAERLLSALSPGPVVNVEHSHELLDDPKRTLCGKGCTFIEYCPWGGALTVEPVPDDCPKPAPDGYEWRLCLLPKGDGDGK